MAKPINHIGFLAFAICLLSLICSAFGDNFSVQGQIYCDTCRVQFTTKISTFIEGATVKLECKDREGGAVTFSKEATTGKNGFYEIAADGDHEEEICKIIPVKSPQADCNEIDPKKLDSNAERVSLTTQNGIASGKRKANPIGFLSKTRNSQCDEVLREMGMTPGEIKKDVVT